MNFYSVNLKMPSGSKGALHHDGVAYAPFSSPGVLHSYLYRDNSLKVTIICDICKIT